MALYYAVGPSLAGAAPTASLKVDERSVGEGGAKRPLIAAIATGQMG